MSLHIIKCKTILKINEIETINLTQCLNFYRHTETGRESTCALGLCRGSWFYGAFIAIVSGRSGQAPSAGRVVIAYHVNWAPDRLPAQNPSGQQHKRWQGPILESPSSLQRPRKGRWARLHLLLLEVSSRYGSLCPQLSTCALLQLSFVSSEGLTQYCQGWLAPNWNDTFFSPSRACNYCYMWGWIRCQSKCFPYVSLFKKK